MRCKSSLCQKEPWCMSQVRPCSFNWLTLCLLFFKSFAVWKYCDSALVKLKKRAYRACIPCLVTWDKRWVYFDGWSLLHVAKWQRGNRKIASRKWGGFFFAYIPSPRIWEVFNSLIFHRPSHVCNDVAVSQGQWVVGFQVVNGRKDCEVPSR